MFDTMTGTKIVGGVCGALLVYLLLGWGGDAIFHLGESGHEETAQAYTIAVDSDSGSGGEEAEEAPDVEAILAEGDAAAGEKVFGKCKACHTVEGKNATGPHLDGVVGRPVASVADYSYSSAMHDHGGDWTPERLYEFIHDPKGIVPGTKMSFAGIKKPQDLADLIAFLESKGS